MEERSWTVIFQNDGPGLSEWEGTAADIFQAIRIAARDNPAGELIYAGLTGFQV